MKRQMVRLRTVQKLPAADKYLLCQATILLAAVTAGLRLFRFRTVYRYLAGLGRQHAGYTGNDRPSAGRIGWIVSRVGRVVPAATCLPQALVVDLLLRQRGYPTELCLGVAQKTDGLLEAHAWVKSRDTIVIGNLPDLDRYVPLPTLKEKLL